MDIVEEIRNDREKGARRLESEYRNGLRTLALRFCDDPGDADELVNRTFAEVVANIDNYAEQSAFFGWMCKILVHLHSKDVRRKEHDGIVYSGTLPDIADADAEEAIFRNLDASLLRDAIETLPADIRKTLLLHYFMEMPVKDVARFLAIPSGTVMWRLHYARQMLAAKLGAVAKKPGVRALLIALAIGATAALGAAVVAIAGARQQAYDSKEAGQQAYDSKEANEPSAPRQDADVGGMPDTSASPIGDIGNIGNTAGSGDSPPTTPPTKKPTMKSTSLLLATPLAALTLASSASDFIWKDSPVDAKSPSRGCRTLASASRGARSSRSRASSTTAATWRMQTCCRSAAFLFPECSTMRRGGRGRSKSCPLTSTPCTASAPGRRMRSATGWATGSSGTRRTSASALSRSGTTPQRSRPPTSASRRGARASRSFPARFASCPTAPTRAPSSTTTPPSSAMSSTTTPTSRLRATP